jgi:hypothetical protein
MAEVSLPSSLRQRAARRHIAQFRSETLRRDQSDLRIDVRR